jgi:hypothetical protein
VAKLTWDIPFFYSEPPLPFLARPSHLHLSLGNRITSPNRPITSLHLAHLEALSKPKLPGNRRDPRAEDLEQARVDQVEGLGRGDEGVLV